MDKKLPVISGYNQSEIELLKSSIAKDLTDTQFRLFMTQAKAQGLNPFTKEIYGTNVKGRLVIMTSINGLRKIAHQTGRYLGCKTEFIYNKDVLYSAKTIVKKLVGSHVAEFEAEAFFDEYDTGRDMWLKMPRGQLGKCSESLALRKAFNEVENVFEESERTAIESVHNEIQVDGMPDYENESQETYGKDHRQEGLNAAREINKKDAPEREPEAVLEKLPIAPAGAEGSPGEFMVTTGRYKTKPTKIKEISKAELEAMLKWAYQQEKLSPQHVEYISKIESYLSGREG